MLKNHWKICFTTILLLTGCSNTMSKNDTTFEWGATESAPSHYPMEIIHGNFVYHGENEQGLYIPSGGTLKAGWGNPISSHSVGERYKRLPDRLKITFFSYAEKQFYQGDFELPYEKILALFKEGVTVNEEDPIYDRIMAGIAPGGVVVVWLTGTNTTEVFFGQAQKIELDHSRAFALPFTSREDSDAYIMEGLVEALTPEALESLKKNGIPFGLWSRYRNRYDWLPTLSEGYRPEYFKVLFVNGEHKKRWVDFEKYETEILPAVPSRISFQTMMMDKVKIFSVHFDEFETMSAFERLGSEGQKLKLVFELKLPKKQTIVRLYNDKESIVLKKVNIDDR